MRKLYDRIQSPAALFAFEAAARHLSFTHAAAELNVSQPAVSHSVRRLEEALGTKLFLRKHRAIELTETGERFYNDVSFGLTQIWRSAERIALERDGRPVTLSTSSAFANYWVVPRLSKFRANNPDIDIRVQVTDKDIELAQETDTIAIRRGDGHWPGYEGFLLSPERIYSVASPGYLETIEPPHSLENLAHCTLIHLDEPFRPRPSWSDWFAQHGVTFKDTGGGLRFNDYALVLQAAMAGEGIAMGWAHITERLIAQKLLTNVAQEFYTYAGFWVVWPGAASFSPQATRVLDWLRSQVSD